MKKTVVVCGFGWSGSSALTDCLRDCVGFEGLREGIEETNFFKGKYSLSGLYRELYQNRSLSTEFLAEFLRYQAGAFDGQFAFGAPERANCARQIRIREEFGQDALFEVAKRLEEMLAQQYTINSSSELVEIVEAASREVLEVFANRSVEFEGGWPSEALVINNDPAAFNLDMAAFYPNPLLNVVIRNYCAVYGDLVRLGRVKLSQASVEKFTHGHAGKLRRAIKLLSNPSVQALANDSLIVQFESFVLDPELRSHWLSRMCAEPQAVSKYFHAEKSIRNVRLDDRVPLRLRDYIEEKLTPLQETFIAKFPGVVLR